MVKRKRPENGKEMAKKNEDINVENEAKSDAEGLDAADYENESEESPSDALELSAGESRARKKRNDDPEAFANAISKILSSRLKSHGRNAPILVRNRQSEKALDDAKLEARAKRALRAEKRQNEDVGREEDLIGDSSGGGLTFERDLKKLAQRGVVKLFNAVRASQIKADEDVKDEGVNVIVGVTARQQKVNELSKEGFLDLIKSSSR